MVRDFILNCIPTRRFFNRKYDELEEKIEYLQKECELLEINLNRHCDDCITDVERAVSNIEQTLHNDINRVINNTSIKWQKSSERIVVEENWGDVTKDKDFKSKYLKLVEGLDRTSIEIINRIILRHKLMLDKDSDEIDFYTIQEQEKIRILKDEFRGHVLKISDELFSYQGYLLPINHFEASVFYYKHGIDKIKNLNSLMGKAIIDVGGYIGDSVLVLNELPHSEIYTFEAEPENYEILKKTIAINKIKNVIAENIALGSKKDSFLTLHKAGSATTSIDRPGPKYTGDIKVASTTLDEYVHDHKLKVGLIKVDIEGGEPAFLAGAIQTICEQRPILLLSIYHNAHDFFELKPLLSTWGCNYNFQVYKPTFENATSETVLIAQVDN